MKQDENTYLRYFLTAFVKLVGKDDVFTTIKNKYKTKEQVQEFLIKLETRVSNLHQIVKPTFEDWNDETTVDYLLGLKSLGQGGMYPILLIGMEYFKSTKDLKKLMALTTKFFFRAKTVCSRNYSDIERLVNEICTKLRSDEETKIDDIKEMMCAWSQYPSNEEFELKFKSLELSDARAKYALSEIHYQMTGGREGAATKISKNAQIEHIMPQKIKGTQWEIDIKEKEGFTNNTELDEYKKINLNKLGNLTLLNNKKNIKNSNKPFLEKKLTYVDTDDIRMTKDLAILPEWDSEAIQLRQKNFISHAMKIWDLKSE